LAAAVLPLAPGAIVTDLATGALYVNAVLAYVMIALVMAGWGPNGAYSLVAGWRFLGQIVAYSMLVVMPIVGVGMRAESLSNTEVVRSQEPLWNAFYQPIGFIVFVFAAMAMAFLPPFDLPTAPGELAGGVTGEYTGVRLAVFRLGRLILVATVATAITVFYLGGWLGPVLPDWLWSALKTLAVIAILLIGGRYLPRIREADLLAWSWKLGIPLALANITIVGVIIVAVD
jgi:NADH-quinone oxidoreductase subunit H